METFQSFESKLTSAQIFWSGWPQTKPNSMFPEEWVVIGEISFVPIDSLSRKYTSEDPCLMICEWYQEKD